MTKPGVRRNHDAGIRYEHDLLTYLRDSDVEAEHLRLHGTEDEGDVLAWSAQGTPIVIQCKAPRSSGEKCPKCGAGAYAVRLGPWMEDVEEQALNFLQHRGMDAWAVPVLSIKQPRHPGGVGESLLVTRLKYGLDIESGIPLS